MTDFALTIHIIHLLVTSLYTHAVPTSVYWWLVQASSAALMVSLGIWACQWRELKPMAFGGRSSKGKERATEESVGLMNGAENGALRGGSGAYEMSAMPPREAG